VTRAAISRTTTVNNKSQDNIRGEDYTVLNPIRTSCKRKLVKRLQTMPYSCFKPLSLPTIDIRSNFRINTASEGKCKLQRNTEVFLVVRGMVS
jgi:hypothetical protein